jgi:hypothetical protein
MGSASRSARDATLFGSMLVVTFEGESSSSFKRVAVALTGRNISQ